MTKKQQTILASRPAAMVLALSLVGGLSAPFVMLPRAQAAPPTLACAENNNNGCTELSPTPPEDTVSVPPNIVLMLDDSGSMSWDYMPDWGYLNTSNAGVINAANNGVYYDPTVLYTVPPQADGTPYPNYTDPTSVPADAFGQVTTNSVNLYTYNSDYDTGNIQYSVTVAGKSKTQSYSNVTQSQCNAYYSSTPNAYDQNWSGGRWSSTATCTIYYYDPPPRSYFRYSTGPAAGPYTVNYVAPASQGCGPQPNCIVDSDTSGVAAPAGIPAGNNIANWFAYYHTRILMAKSGLMIAFDKLSPNYRFGFASINANAKGSIPNSPAAYYVFDDYTSGGGDRNNRLASVQPFGAAMIPDPSDPSGKTMIQNPNSQRYKFWKWLVNEQASGNTPLRKALQGAGEYYKTAQPWTTMQGDPGYTTGSTTKFACRASYTILTTDGFWNGQNPSGIGYAAGSNGPNYTPPAGKTYTVTQYTPVAPFSGGGVGGSTPSLADVATYYWENDLQPTLANEVAPSNADPAFWQHMTTFTMGLGFTPSGIKPAGTTIPQIFGWAQGGTAISGFSWPTPSSNSINNIADLAHAAVNGHGDFFSVKSPQELADGFSKAISDIASRQSSSPAASVNASVLTVGATAFSTGYNTGDWSGQFDAVALKNDGTPGKTLWNAGNETGLPQGTLDADFHSSSYINRKVYTVAYSSGAFSPFQLTAANNTKLDAAEKAGLASPAYSGSNDNISNRIKYLLGDNTYEGSPYRARGNTILGAVIRSSPIYVSGATGNYYDRWPSFGTITAPETLTGAQHYDAFVTQQSSNAGMVYVGANDGMLHAFNAPVPKCVGTPDSTGICSSYTYPAGAKQGHEAWAFVPRAVYGNLGNLTLQANFQYRPTVDGSPVARDVFFSDNKWHTILTGGVGLGGRGVYALDITNPGAFSASNVLWEFDSDMSGLATGCVTNDSTTCRPSDLGYTVSQPNIARLANGKWVVLVPNGYFPDCGTPDTPTNDTTNCQTIANQAPKDASGNPYSALFVLDAQSGKMIAELKTPKISGVTSFGLATPVLGDYNNDQVDDVAFAGDAQGNLWRFDLTSTTASSWAVTLVYKGGTAKDPLTNKTVLQPITSMPHLFPDPATNRFMVVFGTGKFLGVGDNSNTDVQAIYGVRDDGNTYSQSDLTQQYLHEMAVPAGATLPDGSPSPLAGSSLRCVTGGANDTCDADSKTNPPTPVNSTSGKGGWFINLVTKTSAGVVNDAGERVVVTPGAIFASNTVVFETLITGAQSSDPCSPTTVGAIMALNAVTGAPAGASSLGGWPIVGGRINNARTSGSLPVVSALGGGQAYLPGVTLAPGKNPLSIDAPIWRRRSWSEIQQN